VSKLTPDVTGDYSRLKHALLHEFKLSPNTYLERFNSCCKSGAETFVAFASRLKGLLDFYLDSRYVTDFAKLCELLVCDRIKSTLSDSCLQYVLSIESGTKDGWMPVEDLTSSIDRYHSAHSAAGVPRAFAIGAPARPVRPQTFGVRPQSYGARPQSYGESAQTPPAHLLTPSRFNPGTSGAGRGSNSRHSFFLRKRCFECGAITHFRQNCPQLLGKTTPKSEASVSRVGVGILRNDRALKEHSSVASACEQSDNYGIASLFDCVMPSVNDVI